MTTGVMGNPADARVNQFQVYHPPAAGTVTPDLNQGRFVQVFMPAGNITIANPLNGSVGDWLVFAIIQDGVGARLVTWGNGYYKQTGLTLSVGANAVDSLAFAMSPQGSWGQIGSVALALINT